MKFNIKLLYLYLFSFIGLILVVTGGVKLVDLALRAYIFTQADFVEYARPVLDKEGDMDTKAQIEINKKNSVAQKQRDAANAIATIVVGLPLYSYHWGQIKKSKDSK